MIELQKSKTNINFTSPTVISGGGGYVDLSNYYTKSEVDKKIQNVEVDLTGYATEKYVNDAISAINIEETDLTNYYTKNEVNNLTSGFITMNDVRAQGYQTAEQVNTLINEALGVIENGTY